MEITDLKTLFNISKAISSLGLTAIDITQLNKTKLGINLPDKKIKISSERG